MQVTIEGVQNGWIVTTADGVRYQHVFHRLEEALAHIARKLTHDLKIKTVTIERKESPEP